MSRTYRHNDEHQSTRSDTHGDLQVDKAFSTDSAKSARDKKKADRQLRKQRRRETRDQE